MAVLLDSESLAVQIIVLQYNPGTLNCAWKPETVGTEGGTGLGRYNSEGYRRGQLSSTWRLRIDANEHDEKRIEEIVFFV